MALAKAVELLTPEAYIKGEERSEVRHEYVNGHIYAMVGASRRHCLVAMALARHLSTHLLGGPCRAYMSDMKLHIKTADTERFFYPDLMISCDPNPPHDYYEEKPVLLVEVLSSSTESKDRLEKVAAYTSIPSLVEYMLVSQDKVAVDIYRRVGENWILNSYSDGESITLESIGLELPVVDIYIDVMGKVF